MTHFISSRQGLYILTNKIDKIIDGAFFGIAQRGHTFYIFDRKTPECTPGSNSGSIVSFYNVKGHVFGFKEQLSGLDPGGHQMVIYKNHLYLLETHIQRVLKVLIDDEGDLVPSSVEHLYPWKKGLIQHYAQTKEDRENYLHVNAITVQDDRFYVMCANFSSEKSTSKIQVFSTDWKLIDEYDLGRYFCHDLVIIGHEAHFCDCFNFICKLNLVTRQVVECKRLLDAPDTRCHCRGLSISSRNKEVVVSSVYNGWAKLVNATNDTYTVLPLIDSATYITRTDGNDYNNSETEFRKSYVSTVPRDSLPFFKNQGEMIDTMFKKVQEEQWIIKKHNENVPTFEEFLNPKCIEDDQPYFTGNDNVACILQASRDFKKYVNSNVFQSPLFQLSGPFFFYPPTCGRGWHTNEPCLQNSPNTYVRCYSIRTTGGTFFFYKHPVSGNIHAVHDVDKSVNIFELTPRPKFFWHAVGSFTGYRFSVGFMCSPMGLHYQSPPPAS